MGFWVAITRNGDGSFVVSPYTDTCFSSMASSRADWTFGGVLFISSARTMFENTGPSLNSIFLVSGLKTIFPVTSEGSISGVNCILLNCKPRCLENSDASIVLASPGTLSISMWLFVNREISIKRTILEEPITVFPMDVSISIIVSLIFSVSSIHRTPPYLSYSFLFS